MGLTTDVKDFKDAYMRNVGRYVQCKHPSERAGEIAVITGLSYCNTGFANEFPSYLIEFVKDKSTSQIPAAEDLMEMKGFSFIKY